ncbi:MAG: filamentous hemagglutinin N-terminal domain-containing protein [Tolypothrix brevis GSE-NOS-MK-07-07A]|jgi:filamentous hemagglutinin family protein|nr:filamentous hemagglutinin N-terminal domain-containing protein [Tolypothrix brevis GSE-NOS-MK-07-07A]
MTAIAFVGALITGLLTAGMLLPAMAQVTSDSTTNTIVNPNGNNFTILNGIEKGNNLFHSFGNFSVPTGSSARFDLTNTPNISTIFSRVTGGNVSNIDGLIRTLNSNNAVSLFLMNPAGIVFGQNAKLDIGGSFVGTTANSIKFADGTEFSAVNASGSPLLTMSVPIGLQMGSNPGAIEVQGVGHNLTAQDPYFTPYFPNTQGIIGLEFRNTLTPRTDLTNDITASSQFNVNGTVQINNIGVDLNSGLIELPTNVTDPSQQIASGCSANQESKFVATGRGGIAQNPTQEIGSDRTWSDIRDISAYRTTQQVKVQILKFPEVLVQATGWRRNADGKIEIFADKSPTIVQQALTCAGISR